MSVEKYSKEVFMDSQEELEEVIEDIPLTSLARSDIIEYIEKSDEIDDFDIDVALAKMKPLHIAEYKRKYAQKLKDIEDYRLERARSILATALTLLSDISPDKKMVFDSFVHDNVHPIENVYHSEWIRDYVESRGKKSITITIQKNYLVTDYLSMSKPESGATLTVSLKQRKINDIEE